MYIPDTLFNMIIYMIKLVIVPIQIWQPSYFLRKNNIYMEFLLFYKWL